MIDFVIPEFLCRNKIIKEISHCRNNSKI